jgi:hypothetical protein
MFPGNFSRSSMPAAEACRTRFTRDATHPGGKARAGVARLSWREKTRTRNRKMKVAATTMATADQRPRKTSSLEKFAFTRWARMGKESPHQEGRCRGAPQGPAQVEAGRRGSLSGHPHIFSTSGRPKRPEGRKISVAARIEKAATSL